jgi:hypothetical protein
MKTKSKLPENSVALAMVEIDRLQRDRAKFASAKRAVGEQLERQGSDLAELRRRLLAERPRAWARRNREHARRRERLEHEHKLQSARAEAEHRDRLALYAAELEAKRLQLAALDAAPIVERPGRRVLEWAVPAGAIALVAFFGMLAVGGEDAVAHASAKAEVQPESAVQVEVETEVEPEVEPSPAVAPEPVAVAPEPEPPKPVTPKTPKTPKNPKNPKNPPLTLVDPNGDPLG